MTTSTTYHDEGVGSAVLGGIFLGIFSFLRFIFFDAPLVGLTVIGTFCVLHLGGSSWMGDVAAVGIMMLLVFMWWKLWNWQLGRLQAKRIARRVEKLYDKVNVPVTAHARRVSPGRYRVTLYTPDGWADEDVTNYAAMLSSGLHAVSVMGVPDDDPRDGRVIIYVVMRDLLADVSTDQVPVVATIKDAMVVGRTAFGSPLNLSLWQQHLLVGGQSGRGKSVFANLIILILQSLRGDGGVELWGVDPHRTEFDRADFDKLAQSTEDADAMFDNALAETDRRLKVMEERGWKKWDLSEGPAIVLIIDELAAIFTADKIGKDCKKKLTRIFAESRKAGITVVAMTQTPSAQLLGDLRNNAGIRVAFGCANDDQLGQILGDHWVNSRSGVTTSRIPLPTSARDTRGMCYIVGGEYAPLPLGELSPPLKIRKVDKRVRL